MVALWLLGVPIALVWLWKKDVHGTMSGWNKILMAVLWPLFPVAALANWMEK